jgi:hypothetical protein
MKRSLFFIWAHWHFNWAKKLFHLGEKKKYQLGEDFLKYHISIG